MIERVGPGIACALAAAAIYGLIPNFSRAAFVNGVPAFETTFMRTAVIGVALGLLALLRAEKLRVPRAALPMFVAQAAATATVSICYLAAGQFIPVGLAVTIFFTFPVIILLTAPLAEGQAPGWPQVAISLFAFAGLALALAGEVGGLDYRGVLLAVASALACTVQFYSGRKISGHVTPVVLGSLVHLAILPVTLGVALWMNGGGLKILAGEGIPLSGFGFLAGVCLFYVFAYLIHMTSLRLAKASIVAPFYNLEPIVTAGVAALLLGERLTAIQYLGAAMVFTALIVSSLLDFRKRAPVAA